MSKGNLLLLYGKALGSTKVNALAMRWRPWADLKTAGRMSFQCTPNYRWYRSGRRNAHSTSKWQQELLLQREFSTTTEVWVQKSRRGGQDWPDKRVWIWIPLKMWRANSNVGSLHWGPASFLYMKNPFLSVPVQDSCLFSFCPPSLSAFDNSLRWTLASRCPPSYLILSNPSEACTA